MDRYTEASTVPFHSLHMGRKNTTEESHAVNTLQSRLSLIEQFSSMLPSRLLAHPTPFSPPSFYGKFVFGQESVLGGNPHFGRLTDIAVRKFQFQTGLEEDGKAGMITLGKLNERVAAIRKALGAPKPASA